MNLPTPKITMPGFIVVVLLLYLGLALFGSVIGINIKSDNPFAELLKNVSLMALSYFVGTTQASKAKDDTIAAQISAAPAPPAPGTVTTTTTPAADGTTQKDPA